MTFDVERLLRFVKLDRPLVWLDFETTGKRAATARVCQVALVKIRPDGSVRRFKSLINPERPIPASTTAIHGITDEMVKDAPTWASLAPNFAATMADSDYGGYNVRYDLDVTVAEQERCGIKFVWEDARLIDGFRLWQIVEPRTLSDFVKAYLNERADGAHDAGFDIESTIRGTMVLLEQAVGLPNTMAELHDLQFPRDTDWVDKRGKVYWEGTEAALNFGKHKGKLLRKVPRSYLHFIIRDDFPEEVKQMARDALNGRFPVYSEDDTSADGTLDTAPPTSENGTSGTQDATASSISSADMASSPENTSPF